MIKYTGKYPKRIESIYLLTQAEAGKPRTYGARLNDGTLVQLDVRALNYKMPDCGTELLDGTYTVIGQSTKRS